MKYLFLFLLPVCLLAPVQASQRSTASHYVKPHTRVSAHKPSHALQPLRARAPKHRKPVQASPRRAGKTVKVRPAEYGSTRRHKTLRNIH